MPGTNKLYTPHRNLPSGRHYRGRSQPSQPKLNPNQSQLSALGEAIWNIGPVGLGETKGMEVGGQESQANQISSGIIKI